MPTLLAAFTMSIVGVSLLTFYWTIARPTTRTVLIPSTRIRFTQPEDHIDNFIRDSEQQNETE